MSDQIEFLNTFDSEQAEAKFRAALNLKPLGAETVPLSEALGRVLAESVLAAINVPSFDRADCDGFAIRAEDSFGATEQKPRTVRLLPDVLAAGQVPQSELLSGQAVTIATGGMLPRGANAILTAENAKIEGDQVIICRAAVAGFGIAFAGTDVASGETILRAGAVLTSRETGLLAAMGQYQVSVWKRPRVAILAIGNEIVSPGTPLSPAQLYDSNSQALSDAVREIGGAPRIWRIIREELPELQTTVQQALAESDVVLLSGGTSKRKRDSCLRIVDELTDLGIVVQVPAFKPSQPLCLAVTQGIPVVILPCFPTAAILAFHDFVAPVIRLLAGRTPEHRETIAATMAAKVSLDVGKVEYLLVGLVETERGISAFPIDNGSGSIAAFSRADGFVTIPQHTEGLEFRQPVAVKLIARDLESADLVVIGSHCIGLDFLLSELQRRGVSSKLLTVGSSAGLVAVNRGECDVAGIHLLDPNSSQYNRPFVSADVELIEGYGRSQGIVFREGDARFEQRTIQEIIERVNESDATCLMINRNHGSSTRILIDQLLQGRKPHGYIVQPSNHYAVAAAITQGRADWGMTIESVARVSGLRFLSYQEERYDFAVCKARRSRPAVRMFVELVSDPEIRKQLSAMGMNLNRTASPASP